MIVHMLISVLLYLPPSIHPVPPQAIPYVKFLRNEPVFVEWWMKTKSRNPLIDFIQDPSQPVKDRQKAFQFERKRNARRAE
ncbi:MAG: hypothetical protein RBT66_08185 [bacterium]|jgi:hypothetical protein|nr:hypothetical protein [bacterium]